MAPKNEPEMLVQVPAEQVSLVSRFVCAFAAPYETAWELHLRLQCTERGSGRVRP